MLSDEKMDRKIREHVKEHPVILPEDYQAMVQEQIKKCCEVDKDLVLSASSSVPPLGSKVTVRGRATAPETRYSFWSSLYSTWALVSSAKK